jgi:hypothetical protein
MPGMDEISLRMLLDRALGDEPPMGPVARNSLREGKKLRRRVRLRRAAETMAVVAAVVAISMATGILRNAAAPRTPQRGASPGQMTASHPSTTEQLIATDRTRAVTWILQQVSRTAIVACDADVCAELAQRGFANVDPLGPGSPDPLGSTLVVATAAIRAQSGSLLAVYAPAIIASFGGGTARIDIRWVYPGGATAYRAALPAALRARKAAGAQLLTNGNIRLSATARAQLLSGQIDPRLPLLIATMAHAHPLRIVDFASQSPGGGPASLLRSVDLATANSAAHLARSAYVNWMQSFINAERGQFRPARSQQITLPNGQAVLRIEYGAPSPLS